MDQNGRQHGSQTLARSSPEAAQACKASTSTPPASGRSLSRPAALHRAALGAAGHCGGGECFDRGAEFDRTDTCRRSIRCCRTRVNRHAPASAGYAATSTDPGFHRFSCFHIALHRHNFCQATLPAQLWPCVHTCLPSKCVCCHRRFYGLLFPTLALQLMPPPSYSLSSTQLGSVLWLCTTEICTLAGAARDCL